MTRLGPLQDGVAWSTMKVPISLAMLRQSGGRLDPETRSLMHAAITESDNAAAEQLWSALGEPRVAAEAVERVLADAGDASTRVQETVTRPGYTAFGQTLWPLDAQQRFIAALPCLPNSASLLALMREIAPDQSWGLGSSGLPAAFKGGWGPDPSGGYLVRQMGLLKLPSGGTVAVTMAARPADGSFAAGTAELTTMARWLASRLHDAYAPPERC